MEMSGLQKLVQKNGFFKKGHSRPLFLYFCLFNALGNTQCLIKLCHRWDLNREPLESEATALPIEPQARLPNRLLFAKQ